MNKKVYVVTSASKNPQVNPAKDNLGVALQRARSGMLPLVITLIEDSVNQLVNQVGDDVCSDNHQKCEQIVHVCHLLPATRIEAVTWIFYFILKIFQDKN